MAFNTEMENPKVLDTTSMCAPHLCQSPTFVHWLKLALSGQYSRLLPACAGRAMSQSRWWDDPLRTPNDHG